MIGIATLRGLLARTPFVVLLFALVAGTAVAVDLGSGHSPAGSTSTTGFVLAADTAPTGPTAGCALSSTGKPHLAAHATNNCSLAAFEPAVAYQLPILRVGFAGHYSYHSIVAVATGITGMRRIRTSAGLKITCQVINRVPFIGNAGASKDSWMARCAVRLYRTNEGTVLRLATPSGLTNVLGIGSREAALRPWIRIRITLAA